MNVLNTLNNMNILNSSNNWDNLNLLNELNIEYSQEIALTESTDCITFEEYGNSIKAY